MFQRKAAALSLIAIALVAQSAAAAVPESGEINDEALAAQWDGSGPYVVTNVTPFAGEPVPVFCEPTVPQVCDNFAVTVNITDEFRELPENQRESAKIAISFPVATSQEDYDLYFYDASGALVGESATGGQEAITVPLKSLKNGSYTVTVIPFAPLGTNYAGVVQVGKDAKALASGFSLAPLSGSAPLTVTMDARSLSRSAPAGGYLFDFGDGSAPVTDADGVVEHTYLNDGQYLSRVRFSDAANPRGLSSAAQTVFVGELPLVGKSTTQFGGAFGLGALLVLAGAAGRRLRR